MRHFRVLHNGAQHFPGPNSLASSVRTCFIGMPPWNLTPTRTPNIILGPPNSIPTSPDRQRSFFRPLIGASTYTYSFPFFPSFNLDIASPLGAAIRDMTSLVTCWFQG